MDLDLRLLTGFLAVAEELNFTRAAQRLHITQPALTRQILKLEQIIGAPLFDRTTRRVTLSPAGQALREPARRTLASAAEGLAAAGDAAQGKLGRLRIALSVSGNFDIAPPLLRAFTERYSETQVELSRGSTTENVAALKARETDLAFVRTPLEGAAGLAHNVLAAEPLVVALSDEHPLAAYDPVPRDLVAGEPLIIHPRTTGPGSYDLIAHYLWPTEPDPKAHIAEHRPDEETMVQAVAQRLGVALIFQSRSEYLAIPDVTYRPLLPPLYGELSIAWRADDPSPQVQAFIKIASAAHPPVP